MLDEQLLGESSYWRSVYAIRAYQSGGFRRVIFSGGRAAHPVSRAMRDFVVRSGVPDQVIATETESDSTRQNGLLVARMLKGDASRKVLMTSDYHMFRAARVFSKAGLAVQPRPIPDAIKRGSGWKGRWPAFLDICAETGKIAYYYARGWI
jgi:uncharacterized SAM-binding protein YcdF (DUF218 family)